MDIGAYITDEGACIMFGEDNDGVYVGQGGDDFSAFCVGHQRTAFPFQGAN
jgi:hypothetical protein